MTQSLNLTGQLEHHLPAETVAFLRRVGDVATRRGEAAYLVGGGVRDLVLGRPTMDLDVALEGEAAGLAAALKPDGVEVVARSQFLTVKIRWRGATLDISTIRRERYPRPGALPEVEPGSLAEDLLRRDITINALALSLSPETFGLVVDPHRGVEDLMLRRVRVLHEESFRDDATRLWRAMRYEQRLGFALEANTEALARRDGSYLETIGPDRLRHELDRVWQEVWPERVLARAAELGILEAVSPALPWDAELEGAFEASRRATPPDIPLPLVYLALLAAKLGEDGARRLGIRLNLPVEEGRAVEDAGRLGGVVGEVAGMVRPSMVVAWLEPFAPAAVQAWRMLAQDPDTSGLEARLERYLDEWRHVQPTLTGTDLLALGAREGPEVGWMLRALRVARLDWEATTADAEREMVRGWIQEGQWRHGW